MRAVFEFGDGEKSSCRGPTKVGMKKFSAPQEILVFEKGARKRNDGACEGLKRLMSMSEEWIRAPGLITCWKTRRGREGRRANE